MIKLRQSIHGALARTVGIISISTGLVLAAQTASAACEYTVTNSWGSGFTASIRITNDTGSAVNG